MSRTTEWGYSLDFIIDGKQLRRHSTTFIDLINLLVF